jgi:hypothetical protein
MHVHQQNEVTISDVLVVTFTNYGYRDYVLNFYKRLKDLNTNWNLHIICNDQESH